MMLTVSPLVVNTTSRDHYMAADFADFTTEGLPDFTTEEGSLDVLEGIDFYDDLFIEFNGDDVLPDLEIDSDVLGEYSGSGRDEELEMEGNTSAASETSERDGGWCKPEGTDKTVRKGKRKGKKSKDCLSSDNGIKKKPKVDWTPELHRKFVEAVERLGVDKAVPSRILEIMNVKSLNRHNVASHLQKYRSHRKHLLAREAEAASWNLRRHATVAVPEGGEKLSMALPALGYPQHVTPLHQGHFRPLHVWGHPTWPKHKPNNPSSSPHRTFPVPPAVAIAPSCWPGQLPYWHLQTLYPQGYGMASSNHSSIGVPTRQLLGPTNPPIDIHPSNESIDAALGDVITKPWLPLPLGLNPPSVDGVMTELQRQGISNVPPLP